MAMTDDLKIIDDLKNIFKAEYDFVNHAERIAARTDVAPDTLTREFKQLTEQYRTLLEQAIKLTRISDSMQRKLIKTQEDLERMNSQLFEAYGQVSKQQASLSEAYRNLEEAQQKSSALLHNILPDAIAERLKRGETLIADTFPEVSVLFADIVGFTAISSTMSAQTLINVLGEVFTLFDSLCDQFGLEKIKTIGDAYMCVGGLPEPRPDHAEAAAEMALGMVAGIATSELAHQSNLQLRIGIHTGSVVAGVIGRKKFIYDLWGDTVNTASRMESHGAVGQIQVSEATYERLKDYFHFGVRGSVPIKGKGEMKTYFLTGRKM